MAATKSYSIFLGARNSRRRWSRRDERLVQDITLRHFPDGCSLLKVTGAWYDPAQRSFRHEEARQALVTTDAPRKLRPWCLELGRALAQRELLVVELGKARSLRIPG